MRSVWRALLLILLLLTALATAALIGALQWLASQDLVRFIVDGQVVQLTLPSGWGWLPLGAAISLLMTLLFLVLPLLLAFALLVSTAVALIGVAAALSPLLLLGALGWWLIARSRRPGDQAAI